MSSWLEFQFLYRETTILRAWGEFSRANHSELCALLVSLVVSVCGLGGSCLYARGEFSRVYLHVVLHCITLLRGIQ